MAVYKCKMCGGDLAIIEGVSVAECENCGRTQTVPTADSEKKMTLFGRANRLRMACEFDKAAGVYESIVAEFPTESEAYWGLVLCKYGIEYVDDPATGKKVPTCHRSSFDSVMQDSDFEQACENADPIARRVYREEAKAIDLIQKGILEISGKEEPYDIFICYKETAEDGQRTVDSVIAQEVYDALTEKGYRVFFSRITLEDKLGTEYEPYIFAALNSAKVMLAFGTDYEHFNAVWVKNEWSRFLALIAAGQKKALIPCYKGIDAYDMPQEFAHLQGQDMGKVGAIQDLLRGIEKILPGKQEPMKETVVVQQAAGGPTADSLLKRGQLFLGDGDWTQADTYFDKVLDIDPENADAYVGKLCAAFRFKTLAQMSESIEAEMLAADRNYQKAVQFGSKELKEKLDAYLVSARELKKARSYQELCRKMEMTASSSDYRKLEKQFRDFGSYEDAEAKATFCQEQARVCAEKEAYIQEVKAKERARQQAEEENRQAEQRAREKRDRLRLENGARMLAAGKGLAAGVKADGTVVLAGKTDGLGEVFSWRDIVAVAVGGSHVVGLKSDGTVVAAGSNNAGRCDVSEWRGITAIAAGRNHTVGLKKDGTVVAVGKNFLNQCNVSTWNNITAIAAGGDNTLALKSDGSVVWTDSTLKPTFRGKKDIRAIVVGADSSAAVADVHGRVTVALCTFAVDKEDRVENWSDIVSVGKGLASTVGLKKDGTVTAIGMNTGMVAGQCDVSAWRDIVGIAGEQGYTLGLHSDGTVVGTGSKKRIINEVSKWKLFDNIDTLEEERARAKEKAWEQIGPPTDEDSPRAALETERATLQTELANLKGLFSIFRRKEIETRLSEIEAELNKL